MDASDRLDAIVEPVPWVDLSGCRRVHVIGIGGTGMRAIAEVLHAMGHTVTGSDRRASRYTDRLQGLGIDVAIGHDLSALASVDLVTRSTAVPDDDPEVQEARRIGCPVYSRAAVLAAISAAAPAVLVAGTHGKTTTSSLLAAILDEAGRTPSFIIGSDLARFGTGGRWTPGAPAVLEADESDGTFLTLAGHHAIVTSLDPDHLDFYGDRTVLASAFDRFVRGVDGITAVCIDDPDAAGLAQLPNVVSYGADSGAHHRLTHVVIGRHDTSFSLSSGDDHLGRFRVGLPGHHNALNAAGATAIALAMGVDVADIRRGLAGFTGVARRFEWRGRAAGVTFVDDYAHLPAEAAATIASAKAADWRRVVVAYQPHRFSRTEELGATFADAFVDADHLVLTGIYPSGESPRPGVTGRLVHDAVVANHPEASVEYAETLDDATRRLAELLEPGDLCLTLGAGDLTSVPDRVRELLADRRGERLAAQLVSSSVERDADIGGRTTYRVGGPAQVLIDVGSRRDLHVVVDDLREFGDEPLVVGRGSNLLVADRGFDGVALTLSGEFTKIAIDDTVVHAGGAVPLPVLARQTVAAGLTGFEWAVGVPGSIGGAVVMNAGGHGSDMAASLIDVDIIDVATGQSMTRPAASLDLGYRSSSIARHQIVIGARLQLARGSDAEGEAALSEIVQWRREHQPGGQNAGSVFTNPPGDSAGRLIDVAGGKGRSHGSASVSVKHANFIQVAPNGSADDVFTLMCEIVRLVADRTGVVLEPETHLIGFPDWPTIVESPAPVHAPSKGTS